MQYFNTKNGHRWCKICHQHVCKTSSNNCARHFRRQHPNWCEKIAPYVLWSPADVEELVRLVGESIRKQKGNENCILKSIIWKFVANEMNRNRPNGCKLSNIQLSNKWNYLAKQLPENEDYALESEPIEKNEYVYISNFCDFISCQ